VHRSDLEQGNDQSAAQWHLRDEWRWRGGAGRYKTGRGQVSFNGALKDWNKGVGRIEDSNLIFEWKNSDASMQYFAYRKGNS